MVQRSYSALVTWLTNLDEVPLEDEHWRDPSWRELSRMARALLVSFVILSVVVMLYVGIR